MRSNLPKVLHPLGGKSMLLRVLDGLARAGFQHPAVVVGYGADLVEQSVGPRCLFVRQPEQLGTGHAVQVGLAGLPPPTERVLVVHGDEPLIGPEVFLRMLELQSQTGAAVVLLTARVDDTRGFGRVIRNDTDRPVALLQETELSAEQRALDEVNLGAYVFDGQFLREQLPSLQPHPPKGEFYLTDLVASAARNGGTAAVTLPHGEDLLGINDRVQLEQASQMIYRSVNRRLMESGVTIIDSASTFVDEEVEIGTDTVIYPFTLISGQTSIGAGCLIGPGTHIVSSRIGDHCQIQSSTIEESTVDDDVTIGPYAHLRPGAAVGKGAHIGNYAEIKQSRLGPGTRMHHFSYVGDAEVGAGVNIGAGTITANFDGTSKHKTIIEDDAFIGSDTVLRAPVRVGRRAVTGAGAVVTHDVPPDSLAVGVPARIKETRNPDQPLSESSDGQDHESRSKRGA